MQPVPFTISIKFADDEANGVGGRSTIRTALLDAMAVAIQTTLTQILANLVLLQRDDGRIADGIVTIPALAGETLSLIGSKVWTVRGPWLTATAYAKGDIVVSSALLYVCTVAHTSGNFAADFAAANWGQLTASAVASSILFNPTATISAGTVQGAVVEVDAELRGSANLLLTELTNGL